MLRRAPTVRAGWSVLRQAQDEVRGSGRRTRGAAWEGFQKSSESFKSLQFPSLSFKNPLQKASKHCKNFQFLAPNLDLSRACGRFEPEKAGVSLPRPKSRP